MKKFIARLVLPVIIKILWWDQKANKHFNHLSTIIKAEMALAAAKR